MNAKLLREYRRFRRAELGGIVGESARVAIDRARTVLLWDRLESAGLVRLIARADESYDWSDDEERERFGEDGAWGVVGQFTLDGDEASTEEGRDHGWESGDSIWGCVGYRDVTSPYENCYVTDIMAQTIDALRDALRSRCPVCRRPHAA